MLPLEAYFDHSPLNPQELKVLHDQYEKEGNFVGIQTKFNYAWVRAPPAIRPISAFQQRSPLPLRA